MKHGDMIALARKTNLQWELVKKALKLKSPKSQQRLLDMKPQALARHVAALV